MRTLPQIPGLKTFTVPSSAGYDVVYGLAKGAGPEIYLSVSNEFTPGLCAAIYAFDPRRETFRKVIDLEKETGYRPSSGLMPHSKVHLSLQASQQGRVFAATHFTAPAPGQRDFEPMECYRQKFDGSYLVEYDSQKDRTVNYGCLLPREGCRISALDEAHEVLYLVSYPRNHLYQFHYPTRGLRDLGRLGQENSFGLETDERGNLFTTDDFGRFLRFSWADDVLEELDCFVPLKPGRRRQGNYVRRMAKGRDGCLYGFGNKGMHLFRFYPETEIIRDYGLIFGCEAKTNYAYPRIPPAKALAQTDDGSLYIAFGGDGVYLDDVQVPSLVRYNSSSEETTELGRFVDEDGVPAWVPQCALYCKEENSIYFGMQQAVGELRLWKVCLARLAERSAPSARSVSSAHQQKVEAVPFGASVQGSSELPYLHEGNVSMVELGWFGEGTVIPPGESAVSDLCFIDNILYGVTAGGRSHLFRYAPYAYNRFLENYDVHVCGLGAIRGSATSRARLLYRPKTDQLAVFLRSEKAIELLLYGRSAEGAAYRAHYHSLPHWEPFSFKSRPWLDCASFGLADLSLTDLVYDPSRDAVWSLNGRRELVSVHFQTGELSRTGVRAMPGTCVAAGEGRLFAVSEEGEGMLFDLSESLAPRTSVRGPGTFPFSCAVYSEEAGVVALGTRDSRVVIYDVKNGVFRGEARVPAGVRALAAGHAGVLYGYCGEDDGIGEPFVVDLASSEARRLGILQVRSTPRFWINHRCDCLAVGNQGEVYFGEADRISHLLIYFPPHGIGGS